MAKLDEIMEVRYPRNIPGFNNSIGKLGKTIHKIWRPLKITAGHFAFGVFKLKEF